MSSFLHEYRRFQKILFYTGICPFRINRRKSTTIITSTHLSCTYKTVLLLVLSTIITIQFYDLLYFFNLRSRTTASTIKWFQNIVNNCIYMIMILIFAHKRGAHVEFMNGIQRFDEIAQDQSLMLMMMMSSSTTAAPPPPHQIVESHKYYRRMYWFNMLLTFGVWTLNIGTLYSIRNDDDSVPTSQNLMQFVNELASVTFSLASLHIGNLAIILRRRHTILCRHLKHHLKKPDAICDGENIAKFELFDSVWRLIKQFQNIFGAIVLLNATVDLLLLIITTYFTILMGILKATNFELHIFLWTTLTFTMMPLLKNAFLVWSLNGLGKQVSA